MSGCEGETMTHDKEKYRRACSLIEFLTQTAGAMEVAGELHESLSDRVYELIVRYARTVSGCGSLAAL